MSNSNSNNAGIGFTGIIFVVFLALKLAEIGVVATWSWWWVTAPLWIPGTLILGCAVMFFCFAGLMGTKGLFGKRKK